MAFERKTVHLVKSLHEGIYFKHFLRGFCNGTERIYNVKV